MKVFQTSVAISVEHADHVQMPVYVYDRKVS